MYYSNVIAGVGSCLVFLTATTVAVGIIANEHHYPAQTFTQTAPKP